VLLGAFVPSIRTAAQEFADKAGGLGAVLPAILNKRLANILTSIVLLVGLVLVVARLFPRLRRKFDDQNVEIVPYPAATGFVLMLAGAALVVTLIPEFVYLRDAFGSRMNTIFKFYYQGWALFTIAGAYGIYSILADHKLRLPTMPIRGIIGIVVLVSVGMGLLFPIYGIYSRAILAGTRENIDGQQAISLDGWRTVVQNDDYTTLQCLSNLVGNNQVVVAEATGGSYDDVGPGPVNSGRTAGLIGIPTILGWQGHESQWRGNSYGATVGSRADDVRKIFQDLRLDVVQPLLQKYGVDYILYGIVERSPDKYGPAGEQKFLESYEVVCESGNSRIYRVKDVALVAETAP
jgi:uncharacterized membrane protein